MAEKSDSAFEQFDGIPTFRFTLTLGSSEGETIFTECTISPLEWEIQEVKEGGQNKFTYQLPGRRKAGKATLKYGLTNTHGLMEWYQDMLNEKFAKVRRNISITVKSITRKDVVTYELQQAFPTKVTWAPLKTSENSWAVETLELAFHTLGVQMHNPDS